MNQVIELPDFSFSKSFRGYSTQEVDYFLEQVQSLADKANDTFSLLSEKVIALEQEINRLKDTEIALIKALNLAEETKENIRKKTEEERAEWIGRAEKQAKQLVENAQKEVEKQQLLFQQEKNQQKEVLKAELLEQERALQQLKEAQKLVAKQLQEIASITLHKITEWEGEPEKAIIAEPEMRAKQAVKKVEVKALAKKRGGKVKSVNESVPEKVVKKAGRPKKKAEDLPTDDGLPTLGKVLEAYAKSNQPKGGIAEMN